MKMVEKRIMIVCWIWKRLARSGMKDVYREMNW